MISRKRHSASAGTMRQAFSALIRLGVDRGRRTRKKLKVGICGEHGGDPSSVAFCHGVGLDYVSCSPFRVPLARLAAAQAALKEAGVEAVSAGGDGGGLAESPPGG